jgi:sulfur carrier protein
MTLTVNGESRTLDGPCTVAELLERLDLAAAPCAVEVNGDLVPKARHADQPINDGDRLEIVTLVGGG